MAIQLKLYARDVTLLPGKRPAPDPETVPKREFGISHDDARYQLEFDGQRVTVPNDAMLDLLSQVFRTTLTDWRNPSDLDIHATFTPLNRILQRINSTPSYHLFLAGFHIGDSIKLFDLAQSSTQEITDRFCGLVGNLPWPDEKKKKGLNFVSLGYVNSETVKPELIANGKLFEAALFAGDSDSKSYVGDKLFVPYATPEGFTTCVGAATKEAWHRIAS